MLGAACREQVGDCRGPDGRGKKEPERRSSGSVLRTEWESSWGTLASVPCLTWSGWGGQAQHFRQEPRGCVPFRWSEVLRRGWRGGPGRGRAYLGSGPSPSPTDCILWPLFPHLGSCPLCSCFQHRWFHWGELTPSDKDGKPKVHSIPDSSLVNAGGHSVPQGGRLGDCLQTSSLLLISPPGILMTFPFSACATYLGKLASPLAPMAPVTQA